MAKRKRNYRRRRGSFAGLYKLICIVLILGAILASMAIFFKTEQVDVTGNNRYTAAEIIEGSGVEMGDNLFFLNKYQVAGRIGKALPYVEAVTINRKLPSALQIHVTECVCDVVLEQEGESWLLCRTDKIVDSQTALPEGYTVVTGVTLENPAVGAAMTAAEGSEKALDQLQKLLDQLHAKGMLENVQEIHLEHAEYVSLRYLDRLDVEIPWDTDLDYKLNFLAAVVAKLEDYETGTLKMMTDGEARLIS